jgi:hypothetical protein
MASPSTPRSTPSGPAKAAESAAEKNDRLGGRPTDASSASGSSRQESKQEGKQGLERESRQGPDAPAAQPAAAAAPSSPSLASSSDEAHAFATEKPLILSADAGTSVYRVTVDNRTGIATRIERVDEQSGQATELSLMEYVQLAASYYDNAPMGGNVGVLTQAYLQGMKDYLGAQGKGG